MRKEIGAFILSDANSYDVYMDTGVSQRLTGDIRGGYPTIDSVSYIDAECLYYFAMERKSLVTN